ncbi:hypothetical protein IU459_04585 [Nocardia amamiensis]|uniref:Uncharacterized protein n=1 Tax=Nocardia amamiensis TaxID=404578 RepID=A0ABS0CJP0_9NOCA|nr:hypothetical protein [Nocardia amamiensis]MBF6296821.1 hypothetical protein [Nocardia amamiensis]
MSMHIEHEEAMREAFTEVDRLSRLRDRPGASEAEVHSLYAQSQAIDRGWRNGPHPGEWKYLNDVHDMWSRSPSTMRRMLASPGAGGLDGVQRRSIEQARILTAAARPQIERGR